MSDKPFCRWICTDTPLLSNVSPFENPLPPTTSFQELIDAGKPLQLVEADLLKKESWPAAVSGCTYVCHVASPFIIGVSKEDEDSLIKPAVEGTENVLKTSKGDPVSGNNSQTESLSRVV